MLRLRNFLRLKGTPSTQVIETYWRWKKLADVRHLQITDRDIVTILMLAGERTREHVKAGTTLEDVPASILYSGFPVKTPRGNGYFDAYDDEHGKVCVVVGTTRRKYSPHEVVARDMTPEEEVKVEEEEDALAAAGV